jgi:hypothetical protein
VLHHNDDTDIDAGFGLAELIVYAALAVVVLTLGGSMLISALSTRSQVTTLSEATSIGQLISGSIQEGVRNASGPPGTTDPEQRAGIKAEVTTARGQLLRARVAVGSANGTVVWRCQAWYFSSQTEAVYSAVNATEAVADPGGFAVVNGRHSPAAGADEWLLLGEGVRLAPDASAFFGAGNDRVVLRFMIVDDDVSLVLIPTTVVKRTLEAGGTGPTTCY